MRWKGDDDTIDLVLVLALEHSWIMLCDNEKVLRHLVLGQLGLVSSQAFNPYCGRPLVTPNPRSPPIY